MAPFRHILVPLDFSHHSMHALTYAAAIAKCTNGTVHCAHVSEMGVLLKDSAQELYRAQQEDDPSLPSLQGQIEVQLDEAVARIASHGIRAVRHTRTGKPHEQILELASDLRSDLIIMGTHGLSVQARLGRGNPSSVYAKVRDTSPVPVLGVKSPEHEFVTEEDTFDLKSVLCPCSLDEFSHKAVPHAAWWCRTFGATLILAHVAHSYEEYHAQRPNPAQRAANPELKSTEERLEALASEQDVPAHQTMVVRGEPVAELVKAVHDRHVGLVVLATHGRSGMRKAVLGNFAEDLIPKLDCPVLTIHPD